MLAKTKGSTRGYSQILQCIEVKTYLKSKKYYQHLLRTKKWKSAVQLDFYFTKIHKTNWREYVVRKQQIHK